MTCPTYGRPFASFLPEAREALEQCGQFVKKHTG